MKISVYTKFGPINSKRVFDAFIESLEKAGEEIQLNCLFKPHHIGYKLPSRISYNWLKKYKALIK